MTKVMNINKTKTEVEETEVTTEETKAPKTLEELKKEREVLEKEIEQDGKDLSDALYEIDFVKDSNIKSVCTWLDKNIDWDIKTAALTTTLYDTLKSEKIRIKEATEDKDKFVRLNSILCQ